MLFLENPVRTNDLIETMYGGLTLYSTNTLDSEDACTILEAFKNLSPTSAFNKTAPSEKFGRGVVSYVKLTQAHTVMRLYRHGGVFSKLLGSTFFSCNTYSYRSVLEYAILSELYAAGIKVPKPICAVVEKRCGGLYKAAIVTTEISSSQNFLHTIDCDPDISTLVTTAYAVGREVRKCIDQHILHVDLHPGNVLLSAKNVYLIDFDKARRISPEKYEKSIQSLITRWNRAVDKRVEKEETRCILRDCFQKGIISD